MVGLILASSKGKTSLRFFPYDGFLGYSPVTVQGVVKTRLDSDNKPLPAASIVVTVKCIESRIGLRSNSSRIAAQYSTVLWTKSDGHEYEDITNLELPFRILIPADSPGPSTSIFVEYRCIWRIEAVLTHIPIPGVGHRQLKHFQLPLVRYDLPYYPQTPSFDVPPLLHQTHKPGAPSLRYTINPPSSPIGPLDILSVPIYLFPLDSAVVIRSAVATVERRIQLSSSCSSLSGETSSQISSPPSSESTTSLLSFSISENQLDATTSAGTSEGSTITPNKFTSSEAPLLPPPTSPEIPSSFLPTSESSFAVVSAQSTGPFSYDVGSGIYSKTLTLQWPESKSNSRWNVGCTLISPFASVRYFIRVKVVVSSTSMSSILHNLELTEKELLVVPTNDTERQLAASQVAEHEESRSRSKPLRGSRRKGDSHPDGKPLQHPPSESRHSAKTHSSSSHSSSSQNVKRRAYKRPHTSSGVLPSSQSLPTSSHGATSTAQEASPKRWMSANATTPTPARPDSFHHRPTTPKKSKQFISSLLVAQKGSPIPSGANNSSGSGFDALSSMSSNDSKSDNEEMLIELNSSPPPIPRLKSASVTAHERPKSLIDVPSAHPPDVQFEPPAMSPERESQIRAWEEELVRIERDSRKSSFGLPFGFGLRSKRRAA